MSRKMAVFCKDRGAMFTQTRIEENSQPIGLDSTSDLKILYKVFK